MWLTALSDITSGDTHLILHGSTYFGQLVNISDTTMFVCWDETKAWNAYSLATFEPMAPFPA